MSLLSKLVPLVLLFFGVVAAAFVGFVVYTIATDIADKTSKKMERKNVSFGKEGMKIGVKEVKTENYVDQTQKLALLLLFFLQGRGLLTNDAQYTGQSMESVKLAGLQVETLEQGGSTARWCGPSIIVRSRSLNEQLKTDILLGRRPLKRRSDVQ